MTICFPRFSTVILLFILKILLIINILNVLKVNGIDSEVSRAIAWTFSVQFILRLKVKNLINHYMSKNLS